MIHRIEVRPKEGFGDPRAEGVLAQIKELGIDGVAAVRSARLYFLAGELSADDAGRAAEELLADPVIEDFSVGQAGQSRESHDGEPAVIEAKLDEFDALAGRLDFAVKKG